MLRRAMVVVVLAGCGGDGAAGDGGTAETGAGTTGGTTAASTGTTVADGSSADATSGSTLGEEADSGSDACDPPCGTATAPLCVGGVCVACTQALDGDASCAAEYPMRPACDEDGRCVPCTPTNTSACPPDSPACSDANECVPCVEHEQCPASACDLLTGICLASDCVREVDGDGGQEFTTISDAVADLGAGDECTIVVHGVETNDFIYFEDVVIDGPRVALVAGEGTPMMTGVNSAALVVQSGSRVFFHGVAIAGGSAGVIVNDGELSLDRVRVFDVLGPAVLVGPQGAAFVRNSMISAPSDEVAISVQFTSLHVLSSTIVSRNVAPIACSTPGVNATRSVRNSILLGLSHDQVAFCAGAETAHNVLEIEVRGEGNVAIGEQIDADAWFVDPSASVGDLHLSPDGATMFDGIGQWQPGDPLGDFDGDPRPMRAGPDMPGADVPSR